MFSYIIIQGSLQLILDGFRKTYDKLGGGVPMT